MATAALCLINKEIDADWMPVTPFDPLFAIRQKRGEAPPEDPPKTRENRITAVGNDLYSADSRSFLNPFLRISQGVRAFFHRTLDGTPNPSPYYPRRPPTLSLPLPFPSLSLRLPWNLRTSSARVTRNGNCSVSQIMPSLLALYESSLRTHARCVFVHSRKHQYLILLLGQ